MLKVHALGLWGSPKPRYYAGCGQLTGKRATTNVKDVTCSKCLSMLADPDSVIHRRTASVPLHVKARYS